MCLCGCGGCQRWGTAHIFDGCSFTLLFAAFLLSFVSVWGCLRVGVLASVNIVSDCCAHRYLILRVCQSEKGNPKHLLSSLSSSFFNFYLLTVCFLLLDSFFLPYPFPPFVFFSGISPNPPTFFPSHFFSNCSLFLCLAFVAPLKYLDSTCFKSFRCC